MKLGAGTKTTARAKEDSEEGARKTTCSLSAEQPRGREIPTRRTSALEARVLHLSSSTFTNPNAQRSAIYSSILFSTGRCQVPLFLSHDIDIPASQVTSTTPSLATPHCTPLTRYINSAVFFHLAWCRGIAKSAVRISVARLTPRIPSVCLVAFHVDRPGLTGVFTTLQVVCRGVFESLA